MPLFSALFVGIVTPRQEEGAAAVEKVARQGCKVSRVWGGGGEGGSVPWTVPANAST